MFDVTYVIAAHDAADTVLAAIESALGQRGIAVQVVVVDDASADATAQVAASLGDERVHVVSLPANLGPGGARNAGIDVAEGTWIGILDADDRIDPDRSRRMIMRAEEVAAQSVVDDMELTDDAGRHERMYAAPPFLTPSSLDLTAFVLGNIMLDQGTKYAYGYLQPLIRRDLLERHHIRYDTSMRIGEDFLFFGQVLAAGGAAATVPEAGYLYNARPGSVSSRLRMENVLAMLEADRLLSQFPGSTPEAREALDRRSQSLRQLRDYMQFADAVKGMDVGAAASVVRRNPAVLRRLTLPLRVRWRRLLGAAPAR